MPSREQTLQGYLASSRNFWNTKAKENPYWYVSSYGPYKDRNLEEFWNSGENIWHELKNATGYYPTHSDTVVEIGCGVGRITRAIARDAGEVHAFDISEEMIERAQENHLRNATFHVNDGASLDVPAASADAVVAYCVFQHLPNLGMLKQYLREMTRVAKPGGILAFTTGARDWKDGFLSAIRAKAFFKGLLGLQPRGLHTTAWLGIRPSRRQVEAICPFPVAFKPLRNGRWLFYGRGGCCEHVERPSAQSADQEFATV
jgi:2-polyprenyl-3-methyl-5-hydroxy-6-metoxy-1,4-benzoquinol methylase